MGKDAKKFHIDVGYSYKRYLRYKEILGAYFIGLVIETKKPKDLISLNKYLRPQAWCKLVIQDDIESKRNSQMSGAIYTRKVQNTFRLTISYEHLETILGLFKASRDYLKIRKHGFGDLVEVILTSSHSLPILIDLLRGFNILEYDIIQLPATRMTKDDNLLF